MTTRMLLRSLLAVLALTLASCASPTAPDTFTLVVQIGREVGTDRITLDNVGSLSLLFEPMVGSGGVAPDFAQPMMSSFEDGQIQLSVDGNGLLTMLVSRDYVVENAVTDGTGGNPRLELELWTADQMMRMPAPQVRGTVTDMGEQIGVGSVALAAWPLRPGDEAQLTIPCATGMADRCTAAP